MQLSAVGRVISRLGEKSRNLRGYPLHDAFTLLSFFVGWVGGFLKTASALGCGILHLHPRDVSFEWMKLDNRYLYIVSALLLVDDTKN